MSNQASQPSTPEQYLALPPVTVDTAASESRLVANGNANANVQASDIPSYGGDYYEYYYDTPAVGVVQEAEQPNQGLTAPALDPEPTGYALGTTGVASQDNQLQDSTKVAQRMKLAQMRRRLRQKLMKQQQEQKQLQEQQQQQQQQQQQLEQKQQLANSASGFQDEYASELGSGVSGMGLGGLGGLDDSIMDYYDTSLNLGMGDANLSPNIGQRRGVTKKGKKMRRLGGVRYGGLNALGNDLTELGGSGVGTGASLGSGLGSGNGLANYGLGAPSAQLSPTLGMAAGGAVGFGLNSRGGHGHRGGHGGHGGYGHGGHGVIVLKKKKNTDDDNGLFSYLEDLFGELDIDYETFALLLGVAGAIASFVLFTVISSAGRRRSLPGGSVGVSWLNILSDFVYHGLEDFEGKIEKIAGGVDKDENSWLNKLYKQYHGESLAETLEDDNSAEEDEDDIAELNEDEELVKNRAFRKKRSHEELAAESAKKEEEDIQAIFNSVETTCSTKFWRCVSNVVEGGMKYTEMPGGLTGAMKKHLMKVVFAGGINNMWDSLMTVPEARKFQKCMAKQSECKEYEILQKALKSEKAEPQRIIVVPEAIQVEDAEE